MVRRKVAALVALLVLVAGSSVALLAASAGASVNSGPYIDIGCSQRFNVLVYTVVDRSDVPTGAVSALPWACGSTPDLQSYVRVRRDGVFGNIIVRVFRTRLGGGPPLGIAVVPGPFAPR